MAPGAFEFTALVIGRLSLRARWRALEPPPASAIWNVAAAPALPQPGALLEVYDLWSGAAKTNGLKDPIGGLSGAWLEDAAGRETRDEQECIDVARLAVFAA